MYSDNCTGQVVQDKSTDSQLISSLEVKLVARKQLQKQLKNELKKLSANYFEQITLLGEKLKKELRQSTSQKQSEQLLQQYQQNFIHLKENVEKLTLKIRKKYKEKMK